MLDENGSTNHAAHGPDGSPQRGQRVCSCEDNSLWQFAPRSAASGASAQEPTPVILLIVGTGRSGTTILEKTLGGFSNAVTIGEASYIWERGVIGNHRCSDGIRFRDHPFWQRVLARAFPEGVSGFEQLALGRRVEHSRALPLLLLGGRRQAVESYARVWRRLYRAIAAELGSRILVDASKSPVRALLLARSGFDVRVLHVVRDLADVVRSWQKAKFDPGD